MDWLINAKKIIITSTNLTLVGFISLASLRSNNSGLFTPFDLGRIKCNFSRGPNLRTLLFFYGDYLELILILDQDLVALPSVKENYIKKTHTPQPTMLHPYFRTIFAANVCFFW